MQARMDADWQRLKEIVADTLDLPEHERPAFLARACSDDAALRTRAEAMIAAATAAGDFLAGAALDPRLPDSARHLEPGSRLGDRGQYTIEATLGEGGFSEVYRATQTAPIERQVAIKLLKPGMDSRAVLERFELERQTLARMSHPRIARVFDAGVSSNGRPFFVMELVEGEPLQRFVARHTPDLRRRLGLFLGICDAVAHAHQRGIIHRDLKPSNILVEADDRGGSVVVIDFGIAKLLDDAPELTRGMILGTPAYSSPEQLDLGASDIDTRADVFALGVVLFELLAGTRPSDNPDRTPTSVGEILARIRGGEPPAPSRRADLPVPQELDWITRHALEADREQRYRNVDELAQDVRRFLADEALSVGPPTLRYHFTKFARRHRALLAAIGVALLAIVTGSAAAFVGLLQASEARRAAETALAEAQATSGYLARLLRSARTDRSGRDTRVVDMLAAADDLIAESTEFPDVAAHLHYIVGETYGTLGEFAAAERHLRASAALDERQHGSDHPRRLTTMFQLGSLLASAGRLDDAELVLADTDERARRTQGPDHPYARVAYDLRAKAAHDRGDSATAAAMLEGLLALDERDGRFFAVIHTLGNLSQVLPRLGRLEEARSYAERAVAACRQQLAADHPLAISTQRKLISMHLFAGEYDRLVAAAAPLLEFARRQLGEDHPGTQRIELLLARGLAETGRADEAERIYRRLVAQQDSKLGRLHPEAAATLHHLGVLLTRHERCAEAEPLLREATSRWTELRGADDVETTRSEVWLCRSIAAQGRFASIAARYREAVDRLAHLLGDATEETIAARDEFAAFERG
ncbi:MAG: tetratricopeptide repeat protein [Planctomycetes bacterium]|nr:tetratricopeptide repeat protein [Planctomycetota bacterium]